MNGHEPAELDQGWMGRHIAQVAQPQLPAATVEFPPQPYEPSAEVRLEELDMTEVEYHVSQVWGSDNVSERRRDRIYVGIRGSRVE